MQIDSAAAYPEASFPLRAACLPDEGGGLVCKCGHVRQRRRRCLCHPCFWSGGGVVGSSFGVAHPDDVVACGFSGRRGRLQSCGAVEGRVDCGRGFVIAGGRARGGRGGGGQDARFNGWR